ncbi:hypothetical protein GPA27_23220 [Aromatoleum toluolicum]|uniref:DUF1145 domain-containing protein n=1 Tax=Aromatoleum toluolicum TaxID=90060 RepID=A0ABX1NLZ4_9RHOO|nr:hypothetical protein [Aromatoleum toluolicum]NMG00291.1 hypothetical protein [Aromatoleum toluolicum]
MTTLLKGSCLAIYLLALAGLVVEIPASVAAPVRYAALILLGAHMVEVLVAFKTIRLYRGPLWVSILLTVLFGFLHWMPLARNGRENRAPERA